MVKTAVAERIANAFGDCKSGSYVEQSGPPPCSAGQCAPASHVRLLLRHSRCGRSSPVSPPTRLRLDRLAAGGREPDVLASRESLMTTLADDRITQPVATCYEHRSLWVRCAHFLTARFCSADYWQMWDGDGVLSLQRLVLRGLPSSAMTSSRCMPSAKHPRTASTKALCEPVRWHWFSGSK